MQQFRTKKSLGQHFLNNPRVPQLMVEAGKVQKNDTVLEVGPGTGVLTRALLSTGATVIALEADERAIAVLRETFESELRAKKLMLHHVDMRTLDLKTVTPRLQAGKYKVIANIPYYLSGYLFRTFLETARQPSTLVFLVQKEVAFRIARDTKESLLSLSVKVYGDPIYVQSIKRGNFTPPPRVDSAIIAVRNISKQRLGKLPEEHFFALIHAGFASKRKQLLGNLSATYPRETLAQVFSTLGIREDARGEDIPIDTWLKLTKLL